MAALRLLVPGEEVDLALCQHQLLATCHTLHLQVGSLRVRAFPPAKASLPDRVVQVHGAMLHFLRAPAALLVAPRVLSLLKVSGPHPKTSQQLKSRSHLPLDPVQISPREHLRQSLKPMLKQQDSLPMHQFLR